MAYANVDMQCMVSIMKNTVFMRTKINCTDCLRFILRAIFQATPKSDRLQQIVNNGCFYDAHDLMRKSSQMRRGKAQKCLTPSLESKIVVVRRHNDVKWPY